MNAPDGQPPLSERIMGRVLTSIQPGVRAAMETVLSGPDLAVRYAEAVRNRPAPAADAVFDEE